MNHFIIINTPLLLYHCWGLYLQIFIQLIHQASEELISILLFSYIQLPVPHLKNLQHTMFAIRQQASCFLTASNRRIMIFRTISNIKLPSRSSQVCSTAACSPSDDQTETGPGRRHFLLADQCHPQWRGRPEINPHLETQLTWYLALWCLQEVIVTEVLRTSARPGCM